MSVDDIKLRDFVDQTEEEKNICHIEHMRYLMLNPNNFSYWFPKIMYVRKNGIEVPKSFVIDIPEDIYHSFFQEREFDRDKIFVWVKDFVLPVLQKNFPDQDVFLKNGCFSNKFEFDKSCHILKWDGLKAISEKIINLQYMSLMHGTDGYLELVLREWIDPEPETKTIYGGMPLRAEMRLFYDFTAKKPLYYVNYWDWDYCHDPICDCCGDRTPDADVYEEYYPFINEEVELYTKEHWQKICDALAGVELYGKWSVDFILEKDRVILIDMAIASKSAYWDAELAELCKDPKERYRIRGLK